MAQQIDGHVFTATVAVGAVSKYELCALNGGKTVTQAGAGSDPIGTARVDGAIGEVIGVNLLNKEGTLQMIAAGVIAVNASVEPAAAGRIQTLAAGQKIGRALQAAGGAGEIIEVLVERG